MSAMGKLTGKVAIVTGATSGIGEGITRCFASEGAQVIFCGRREEKGKTIEAAIRADGGDVTFVKADVTIREDIEKILKTAQDTYGGVDILVNNAGTLPMFNILEMDIAKHYDDVMALNLRAYFETTSIIGRQLRRGGAIVNLASIGGLSGTPGMSTYGASKAAVLSLTRSSAKELAAMGIRVNAICPGTIFSEMMPRDGEFTKGTISLIPLGRGGEPEEIGKVALFFASDDSSYVTGAHLVVDGGMTA